MNRLAGTRGEKMVTALHGLDSRAPQGLGQHDRLLPARHGVETGYQDNVTVSERKGAAEPGLFARRAACRSVARLSGVLRGIPSSFHDIHGDTRPSLHVPA